MMTKHPLVDALEKRTAEAMQADLPLAERLKMIAEEVRLRSPEFTEAVETFVGRLKAAEAGAQAPQVGDVFPDFVLPDHERGLVSLEQLLSQGPVVVVFLRGHWCPYCRITAGAMGEFCAAAAALGGQLVAITPESRAFALRLQEDAGRKFPILLDVDNGYALSLNLAIWVETSMADMIAGAGWDIPAYQHNDAWLLPIPAAFVLDRDGRVAARHVNPDYRERFDVDVVLGALAGLKGAS